LENKDNKRRPTCFDFITRKAQGHKIASLSLYDTPTAKIAEDCGIDLLLVGDSLGMTVLGHKNTIPVTMDDMLRHSAAVRRGAEKSFIVADMPFMSYQTSVEDAMKNAARFLQESSCDAVKIEGGKDMAETIRRLVSAGIPVMAHIGLLPQKLLTSGGYRKIGSSVAESNDLLSDAKAVEDAGAFCVVLECVEDKLAGKISKKLKIPTIGIGSGELCDGQIQVVHDVLGLLEDFIPKHAKRYANLAKEIRRALSSYAADVRK